MQSEQTKLLTIRQALKIARADLDGQSYLSGANQYELVDGEMLYVRNRSASDGGCLLSVFEAERVNRRGETTRKYRI